MSQKPIQEKIITVIKLKKKKKKMSQMYGNKIWSLLKCGYEHLGFRRHVVYLSLLIWSIFYSLFRQPKLEIWMNSYVCTKATIHVWPWKMCGAERLRIKRPPEIEWISFNLFNHNKAVSNLHKLFRFLQYLRFRFSLCHHSWWRRQLDSIFFRFCPEHFYFKFCYIQLWMIK